MFLKNICFFLLLVFFSYFSFSQQGKTDSLFRLLISQKEDSSKVSILIPLAEQYFYRNIDSAIYFSSEAKRLSEKLNDSDMLVLSYISLGWEYYLLGNYPDALRNCYDALKIIDELENSDKASSVEKRMKLLNLKAQATGNAGNVYWSQGDYPKALDQYVRALELAEECGNKNEKARHQVSVGNTYLYQAIFTDVNAGEKNRLFGLALDYFLKGLGGFEEIGNKNGIAVNLGNIGMVYGELGKAWIREKNIKPDGSKLYPADRDSLFNKALEYTLRAFRMAEESGNMNGMAMQLGNLGSIYLTTGKFKDSETYLKRALSLSDSIGDLEGTKEVNQNLSNLYDTLASFSNFTAVKRMEYLKLSNLHYRKFIEARDTLESEDRERESIRTEMNYEYEKKEAVTRAEHEKQIAIAEAEKKKQKIVIWSVAGGLLLVIVFAGMIMRSLRITRKQKEFIEIQKARVETQNKLVEFQKRQIEEKHKETTDSITYAKRLQQAILPPVELIKKNLPESFVLYKPKDIVAGDFYWMEVCPPLHARQAGQPTQWEGVGNARASVDSKVLPPTGGEDLGVATIFVAAADCTGHGVPGAMVSVVCSNALNRAVKEFNLRDTGKILDKVTDLVLETFEKSSTDVKDGMDISLLRIELKPGGERRGVNLQWSGANNPLWYFQNGKINEIKANKQPVGKYDNRKPFTTHTIELTSSPNGGEQEGTVFYLFTDGLPDQFGGPKGKKFLYKRFEENLFSICNLSLADQEKIIENSFEEWKGKLEQVDDVTVIGIRI